MNELLFHIENFFGKIADESIEIYNEFSLQHELGLYLRLVLSSEYKIQFERHISYFGLEKAYFVKREIDIAIFNRDHSQKYAIELKYPKNGQYPEQMFQFCKDIYFMEQLVDDGFDAGYFVVTVDSQLFYQGNDTEGIYRYFRSNQVIHGEIAKPTGAKDKHIYIEGFYEIRWTPIKLLSKYSIVSVEKLSP